MNIIVFDLDGTLADVSHRRLFLDKNPPNWKDFNYNIPYDKPNQPIIDLYLALKKVDGNRLVIFTGRQEDSRIETDNWIFEHMQTITTDCSLFMRKTGDFRGDSIVKQEMIEICEKKLGSKIVMAVDDRDSVVKMWRDNGITCLQCAYGDF